MNINHKINSYVFIGLLIAFFIIISLLYINYVNADDFLFSDIKDHWAKNYIVTLTSKGIINGYPDGTFKPENNITKAEAIKLVITAIDKEAGTHVNGHWAIYYYNQALKNEYVLDEEIKDIDDLNTPITRGEITRILSRAIVEEPNNLDIIKGSIVDFDSIPDSLKNHVLKVYGLGIVGGYPDGTFKYNNKLTRAEAAKLIVNFIDPSERKVPELITNTIIIDGEEIEVQAKEIIKPYNEMIKLLENAEGYYKVQYSDVYNDVAIYYNLKKEPVITGYIYDYDFVISIDLEKNEWDTQYKTTIYTLNENTYSVVKEVLKVLYPENYETAFDIVKNTADTKVSSETQCLDNRNFTVGWGKWEDVVILYIGGDK